MLPARTAGNLQVQGREHTSRGTTLVDSSGPKGLPNPLRLCHGSSRRLLLAAPRRPGRLPGAATFSAQLVKGIVSLCAGALPAFGALLWLRPVSPRCLRHSFCVFGCGRDYSATSRALPARIGGRHREHTWRRAEGRGARAACLRARPAFARRSPPSHGLPSHAACLRMRPAFARRSPPSHAARPARRSPPTRSLPSRATTIMGGRE